MKKLLFSLPFLFSVFLVSSMHGQVTIGSGVEPQSFSILEVISDQKLGGLRLPQLTLAQRTTLTTSLAANPLAKGLTIFNLDSSSFQYWDGNQWIDVKASESGLGWGLSGNTATNPSTNFVGTSDNQPLIFKVNNTKAAMLGVADNNNAWGWNALASTTTGTSNTAMGTQALQANTTGTGNTAVGVGALASNLGGNFNIAIGNASAANLTSGSNNIAIGNGVKLANPNGNNQMNIGDLVFATGVSTSNAKLGIGTTAPNTSAILDVTSGNQGVLLPRVALTSSTDIVTIANPATGLLVYNTGTAGLSAVGYVLWSGSAWVKINTSTTVNPSIKSVMCSEASMNPGAFTTGVPYSGTMTIPYTGGNGGSYAAGVPILSSGNTGLTATLQSGTLNNGNGSLIYNLTGVPLSSSPLAANFNINVLGQSCTASLTGAGTVLGVGQTVTFIGTIPIASVVNGFLLSSLYPTQLPVIDGLRMDLTVQDVSLYRPRVYNVSSVSQLVSYQSFATQVMQNKTLLNVTLTAAGTGTTSYTEVDYDGMVYWTTSAAEVETVNFQVQVSAGVWRWYEMKWWCMELGALGNGNNPNKTIFMSVQRKA